MFSPNKLLMLPSALVELGVTQLTQYTVYQLALRSGFLKYQSEAARKKPLPSELVFHPIWHIPNRDTLGTLLGTNGLAALFRDAQEVASGKARLFGRPAVSLDLAPAGPLRDWTELEQGGAANIQGGDIKFTWEPARFGWVYSLGRAYCLTGDERWPAAFWSLAETFLDANPPYLGPNWVSAQEVALRLLALTYALQIFGDSPEITPLRSRRLKESVIRHAARLPFTLAYARSQNNNHLLSEAVGLYAAGTAMLGYPDAPRWRALGWRWFNRAVQSQIDPDGAYIQHSTNYHRLVLHLALWMNCLAHYQKSALPVETMQRLAAATRWLLSLVEITNGFVPNLGPNDGAYILPLTSCAFEDYRPILQAASMAFLGSRPFKPGAWDEMALWLAPENIVSRPVNIPVAAHPAEGTPHVIRSPAGESWAYLRAAVFHSRPGHADQLHLDLWWRGLNIAIDPGTYRYHAPAPWDNALVHTVVHNTLVFDSRDQMTQVGRFLFLNRAQAQVLEGEQYADGNWQRLVAQQDGYRRSGLLHRREVAWHSNGWRVIDQLLAADESTRQVAASLHWLMPDLEWRLLTVNEPGFGIEVNTPQGWVQLTISAARQNPPVSFEGQLVRAGELVSGQGNVLPIMGWTSPFYGDKIPALSVEVKVTGPLPVQLVSFWRFPVEI